MAAPGAYEPQSAPISAEDHEECGWKRGGGLESSTDVTRATWWRMKCGRLDGAGLLMEATLPRSPTLLVAQTRGADALHRRPNRRGDQLDELELATVRRAGASAGGQHLQGRAVIAQERARPQDLAGRGEAGDAAPGELLAAADPKPSQGGRRRLARRREKRVQSQGRAGRVPRHDEQIVGAPPDRH